MLWKQLFKVLIMQKNAFSTIFLITLFFLSKKKKNIMVCLYYKKTRAIAAFIRATYSLQPIGMCRCFFRKKSVTFLTWTVKSNYLIILFLSCSSHLSPLQVQAWTSHWINANPIESKPNYYFFFYSRQKLY